MQSLCPFVPNSSVVAGISSFHAPKVCGAKSVSISFSCTVNAVDKEGKIFKGWQDESGEIVSTEKSYTFTVTGDRSLTAVYENVLATKKGLSDRQVAGIIIGSVVAAGLGGFAIFWFVIKKKGLRL